MLKNSKILVVVAHPDDEVLGLGATMHNLIAQSNCVVRAVILGEGITSRDDRRDDLARSTELKRHRANIESARSVIGYNSVGIYDFPDNRFDSVDLLDIIKIVELEKSKFKPDYIFTHHGEDLNVDHRITHEAVLTATRPLNDEKVSGIFSFETPSATEWRASKSHQIFCPNYFYRVTEEDILAKIQSMECYEYERRDYPHPRSPEALDILAKRYGVMIGSEYAEAFEIIRLLNRKD